MRYPRFPAFVVTCVALVAGCVSDHTIESDVPASAGIVQPGGNGGAKLTAAVACERITGARSTAAKKLGCDDPKDECPRYLFVAGSMPCAEYSGDSVDACVSVIEGYRACKDFSEKGCVATPVEASCRAPAAPDAGGGMRDSGGLGKDAGRTRDSGGPATEAGGHGDGSADADRPDG
jgi:hypothetical protein